MNAHSRPALAPGVYADIPDAMYHADDLGDRPSLSSTLARLILNRSPRHAWAAHPKLNPLHESKDSATFDIGRAIHRAILGRGGDYAAIPANLISDDGGVRSKAARDWVSEARAAGLTPLKADVVTQIEAIASVAKAKLAAMGIRLDPSRSEMSALAEIDGVLCRCRVDNAPLDPRLPLYDVKSCEDASPDAVIRSIAGYGYDSQAAFYLDTWFAATGDRRKMRFIFVEKAAPYEVSVVELYAKPGDEADWMDDAHGKAAEARRVWGECLTSGDWPGYPPHIAMVGAPGWYRQKWENYGIAPKPEKPSAEVLRAAHEMQAPERKAG